MRLIFLPKEPKYGGYGEQAVAPGDYHRPKLTMGQGECISSAQTTGELAKLVAVKKCHVTDHVEHPRLVHEACALVLLRGTRDVFSVRWHSTHALHAVSGHRSIPLAYVWGRSQYYEYLAMEVLSVDLSVLKANLTMRNLAVLAHQLVSLLVQAPLYSVQALTASH